MRTIRAGNTRRAGYTLIEMTTVIAATSAVMLVGVLTIQLAVDAEKGTSAAAGDIRSIAAAAEAFRGDVHAARRFEPDEAAPGTWRLSMEGDRVVEYSVAADRLRRRLMQGEAVLSTSEFIFPKEAIVTVASVASEAIEKDILLRLEIAAAMRAGRSTVVEAVLGRDRRFHEKREEP